MTLILNVDAVPNEQNPHIRIVELMSSPHITILSCYTVRFVVKGKSNNSFYFKQSITSKQKSTDTHYKMYPAKKKQRVMNKH